MTTETDTRILDGSRSQNYSFVQVRNVAQFSDCFLIGFSGLISYLAYIVGIVGTSSPSVYLAAILVAAIGFTLCGFWLRLYDKRVLISREFPVNRLLGAWVIVFAVLLFLAFSFKVTGQFSRIWAISWFFLSAIMIVLIRFVLYRWIQRQLDLGNLSERVVIYGSGQVAVKFARQLQRHGGDTTKVVGFIDDDIQSVSNVAERVELLGDFETLLKLIRTDRVDKVYLAFPMNSGDRARKVVEQLADTPVPVCVVIGGLGYRAREQLLTYVGDCPVVQVFEKPIFGWSYTLKFLEDKIISSVALMLLAPVFVLISLSIKFDSDGPIFFKQKRLGFNNKPIIILKFRTMYQNFNSPYGVFEQVTQNDSRVTRVGRLLRKSSLDELPQLFNVLVGDMSIVGPRPHAVEHCYEGRQLWEMVDHYAARHRVKPGITGWAQVNGWRGETDTIEKLKKRVEYDLFYIDNWSLWFDLYIMVKTFFVVFTDENAY